MRIYTVHELPGAPLDGAGLVLVKEGFSFPAFLLSWVWLAFNRLWIALALWIGLTAVVSFLAERLLGVEAAAVCSLALQLLLGFEGNDIRRWTLARKGYREIGISGGSSLEEAERRFFEKWDRPLDVAPVAPLTAPVWPRRDAVAAAPANTAMHEVFGLFPEAGPKRGS
ncbi:MAG: DUF2628 domain-containing protein [Parvibaculum sp.]|uniref:DUF2628 domain-containing protein n=1 Tax=Parvibaculum sp. TaxID=2024848 RepID=UPI002ABA74D2|nr:DUF2628 domain-containing protein [Parvibaculum sp.]MDZ4381045.1 DUF2628 domain-containing protein [Parvibaculum sp.]